jgi:hypothetical protein
LSSNSDEEGVEPELTGFCSTITNPPVKQEPEPEPENEIASKCQIPSSVITPSSVRRPMDLAIAKAGTPNLSKKKLWSTIDHMISPLSPFLPHSSDDGEIINEIKSEKFEINNSRVRKSMHHRNLERNDSNNSIRYLNTFRKLSSRDDGESSTYSSSDKESSLSRSGPKFSPKSSIPEIPSVSSETRKTSNESRFSRSGTKNMNSLSGDKIESEEIYQRASVFMYCFGAMRLLIVLDPSYEDNSELINALWGYGSSSIIDLKEAVTSVEEQSQFSNQNDPYCFLRYESVWKSLAHGGRNEVMDFNTVQLMHRDFTSFPNIHELIIRGEDHVVYGYQCVGSEVYYQQSAGPQPGLPMPSDLMGKVPQKAKRRLERDHSILIL